MKTKWVTASTFAKFFVCVCDSWEREMGLAAEVDILHEYSLSVHWTSCFPVPCIPCWRCCCVRQGTKTCKMTTDYEFPLVMTLITYNVHMNETILYCKCILVWCWCFLLLRLKCDWLEASSYAEQLYLHSRWSKVFVITRNPKHADITDGIGSISRSANISLHAIHSFRVPSLKLVCVLFNKWFV